jgi:hypothetical protein
MHVEAQVARRSDTLLSVNVACAARQLCQQPTLYQIMPPFGTQWTWRDVGLMSALRSKADVTSGCWIDGELWTLATPAVMSQWGDTSI